MPGLWHGYEFAADDLRFWSEEIFAAAVELPEAERTVFVEAACDGSATLGAQVHSLLANGWPDQHPPLFNGVCRPGDTVRDCFILRPLGRGGMGEVYKAIQRQLHRVAAVKVVAAGRSASLFGKEAANTARLVHPHIATVYDADLRSERPCIVMEYVEGISLRAWLERHGSDTGEPPPADVVRTVVRQVALALGEAHRHGLLHGDIKPENILLTRRADQYAVKVVDFGIARRTDTPAGVAAGTPGYLAPEQLNGAAPDSRADVFALGVVLYELLTGKQPFAGRTDIEKHFNTLRTTPDFECDEARSHLSAVARRALQKAPQDRYPTAEAFIADLDAGEVDHSDRNPLLSELPMTLQRWWARRMSGFALAFFSLLWGCLSLVLSIASRSGCVRVVWAAPAVPRVYEMLYGYAVEPNAGFWYVVGAPLCFLTGYGLLEAAFTGMARTPSLVSTDAPGTTPLQRIAALNRRYFSFATPLIIVIAICFVAIPELVFRGEHAFGWVQADMAGDQVSKSYEELQRSGKVGQLPAVEDLCEGCPVHVAAVFNTSAGYQPPPPMWFGVFLAVALAHQIAFTSFGLWIAAKVLFVFRLLSMALLGDARSGLRLTPDFRDQDDYRFGLGRLDNVYYGILVLVVMASFGVFLQAAANVAKGTYLLSGDPAPALFGQVVSLLATLALLAVALVTPVSVFLFLTIRAVAEELARLSADRKTLDARLAGARSVDERARLRFELEDILQRRDTVRRQTLLPIRRPVFLALVCASLLMLIGLPLSIQWFATAGRMAGARQSLSEVVCAACGNAPVRRR